MLDLGWVELAVVGVIALLVVGPKDLPKVLRTLGQWARRLRGLAREFQGHVDDMIRESDLDDLRDGVNTVRGRNLGRTLNKMVDPDGSVTRDLDEIDRRARQTGPAAPSGGRGGGGRGTVLDHGTDDPTGPADAPGPHAPGTPNPKSKAED
ncbi:Sec-independent protein translocase protein TatB [Roseospira visakhapatnamensis]|uniref:Sec-independent protein translocase protein TatB n=1 Tax=Roseospira visakhapatnamensis TaxID=390880 RepID=A0A7W6RA70_9PROT|nr:Sec-independent protein translocase protein TatB [Roseospira visakhapatnamensis]MBB4264727.1 sec-independent protein translocase protein TatB [Roseospira visakhapatnamensis]